jgi:energy-coupling factor transporter ATP-binding protein EcfA2
MFADSDFRLERAPRVGEEDLIADLELNVLWQAMAQCDEVVWESASTAILDGLTTPEQIRYRQAVLADCLANRDVVREIYALAVQAVADEKQVYRGMYSSRGEALVRRSITILELHTGALKRLRQMAEHSAGGFRSAGFVRFFETIRTELDEDYFREVAEHLRALRFRDGVVGTARLGKLGQGVEYVLRFPQRSHRLLRFLPPSIGRPSFSWTIPPRDDAGSQAMGALRDRVLALVANSVGQSADHVTSFFTALRVELGFYVGCINLSDPLSAKGEPLSMPEPHEPGSQVRRAQGLYDPCLSLRIQARVQSNDLRADGKPLIIVTGANQGGKSTFLRSVGLAQLMMQAGMFVAADRYAATIVGGVFTHYKREEDATMVSGKFDEELARMSALTKAITAGDLLLCNESFAATNEREGSEIAGEVIRAMTDNGSTVVFVTHLYELASGFHRQYADRTLFLRADRESTGARSFQLQEAGPLPTSYGADLYRQTFSV